VEFDVRPNTATVADKRGEPRIKTSPFKVNVLGECGKLYGYARDLSASGMQVRTFRICDDLPKRAGNSMKINFRVPENDTKVECKARVLWSRTPSDCVSGVEVQGVEFVNLDEKVKRAIADWVANKSQVA
jgi:c-di-GMP-binding flagellar brake protein YcgR